MNIFYLKLLSFQFFSLTIVWNTKDPFDLIFLGLKNYLKAKSKNKSFLKKVKAD
jgi:hypothetical protein